MKVQNTFIEGLLVISPDVYSDTRGWFSETYNFRDYSAFGIHTSFIQDNHSLSLKKGILRGLHLQISPYEQTKLIKCTRGSVWDVAVDLRKSSKTFLKWFAIELTSENHLMLYIPKGFAHGFITLEDNSEVQYKVDNYYNKSADRSIRFDDESIGITWPLEKPIVSDKDFNAPNLSDSDVSFL